MRTYQDVNFSVSVCACIFQNLQMHVSVLCVSSVSVLGISGTANNAVNPE